MSPKGDMRGSRRPVGVDEFFSPHPPFFATSLCRIRSNGVVFPPWAFGTSMPVSQRGTASATQVASSVELRTAAALPMLATFLSAVTSRQRAWAIALLWLLALTILNVQTRGAFRPTILFAIPVAIVSWHDCQLGLVFAALSIVAARFGSAIPEPGSPGPLWLDGTFAFLKLGIDAVVINAWGRRHRRRTGGGHARDWTREGGA